MSNFIQIQGKQFILQGKPFKFIGVTIRDLLYDGYIQAMTPVATLENWRLKLIPAYALGAKMVRLFLPHKQVTPEETINYLGQLIAEIKKQFPTLYLLPTLTNFYDDARVSAFYMPGNDKFYETSATFCF